MGEVVVFAIKEHEAGVRSAREGHSAQGQSAQGRSGQGQAPQGRALRRGSYARLTKAGDRDQRFLSDLRRVRDLVTAFAPMVPPRQCRRIFKAGFDMFEALCLYAMVVELEWGLRAVSVHFGRNPHAVRDRVSRVEEIRDRCAFVDKIMSRVREGGHVIL